MRARVEKSTNPCDWHPWQVRVVAGFDITGRLIRQFLTHGEAVAYVDNARHNYRQRFGR